MTERAKGRIYNASGGCDEDCFHRRYPDCYKPAYSLKTDIAAKAAVQVSSGSSQNRMYILELGGAGRNTPNLSRKYYL